MGTAYHTSCRLWFTLSHGIINEIYYPNGDQPNTRDFQFLITDGESFCHEEKPDLDYQAEYPERDGLLSSNADHEGALDLWFADFPTADWPSGSIFNAEQRWHVRNWQVKVL